MAAFVVSPVERATSLASLVDDERTLLLDIQHAQRVLLAVEVDFEDGHVLEPG